jgi:hypothetical protein
MGKIVVWFEDSPGKKLGIPSSPWDDKIVIPAMWKVEVEESGSEAGPGQKGETLSQK